MSEAPPRSLWSRIRWMVVILWVVAGVKFALDFREEEDPIVLTVGALRWQGSIGVYYVVVLLLLVASFVGTFRGLGYKRLVLAMLLLSVLGWGVPNTVVYTTAQFKGWTHGRFAPPASEEEQKRAEESGEEVRPNRSGPIAEGPVMKVLSGLGVGAGTTGAGFVWNFLWMNLLIVFPARFGRRDD